jgi:hypothetical protein
MRLAFRDSMKFVLLSAFPSGQLRLALHFVRNAAASLAPILSSGPDEEVGQRQACFSMSRVQAMPKLRAFVDHMRNALADYSRAGESAA